MDGELLYHEVAGDGPPALLLHPGFADSRIWDPQWGSYPERFRVVRCDLRGFGRSPIQSMLITYALDVAALLDRIALGPAAIVGCSLGARVALELALARPDLVSALVLVGAATPEALASAPEIADYASALTAALSARDLEAAVEVNVHAWVDGPRRTPEQVDPRLRRAIAAMQRDALIHTRAFAANWSEETLVSGLADRLGEITVPSLVLVGELDMDFLHDQARLFSERIGNARLHTLSDTAHAPSIERPDAFDEVVVPFLAGTRRQARARGDVPMSRGPTRRVRKLSPHVDALSTPAPSLAPAP